MSQCSLNIALKILILIILFSQFFVTDAFLANQFYYYGIDIFNYYRFHDKIVKLALFDHSRPHLKRLDPKLEGCLQRFGT